MKETIFVPVAYEVPPEMMYELTGLLQDPWVLCAGERMLAVCLAVCLCESVSVCSFSL